MLNMNEEQSSVNGITIYTDAQGDKYVRVKICDEDFCIAPHDYIKDDKAPYNWSDTYGSNDLFDWNDVTMLLKDNVITIFTRKQAAICAAYQGEIGIKLSEIEGETLNDGHDQYWTSTEFRDDMIWSYFVFDGNSGVRPAKKFEILSLRPVINL